MAKKERITVKAIIDYPNIFEPKKILNQGKEVYSATIIIPKDGDRAQKTIDKITDIFSALSKDDERLNGKGFWRIPLIDGDSLNSDGNPYPERYHDAYILRAKSNYQPHIYCYNDMTELYEELEDGDERVFAGMEAAVTINFFAYSIGGNRGIGVGLGDMCVTGKGEHFYDSNTAAKQFDAFMK